MCKIWLHSLYAFVFYYFSLFFLYLSLYSLYCLLFLLSLSLSPTHSPFLSLLLPPLSISHSFPLPLSLSSCHSAPANELLSPVRSYPPDDPGSDSTPTTDLSTLTDQSSLASSPAVDQGLIRMEKLLDNWSLELKRGVLVSNPTSSSQNLFPVWFST